MTLPCVKFISHFASYIFFILMVVASFLNFADEESPENMVEMFPHLSETFHNYSKREDLVIHLDFTNFYIRENKPRYIDIIISVWIIGIHLVKFKS